MRKNISIMLIATMVFSIISFFPQFEHTAYGATEGIYTYEVSGGKATITACLESVSGAITIPSTLGGYPVTTIGNEAFYGCYSLTSVTIPNSVTSIGNEAFRYCYILTSITIPNSVITIGDGAFYYCYSLTSITIPNSVTTIGNHAFYCCSSLTSITIPNGVTTIGNGTFTLCTSLTSITIPNSVTTIGSAAFIYCLSLTSVTIPNSIITIGGRTFYNCHSLKSITIPNSVTTIGDGVFYGCLSLTSVTIPSSVTTIGKEAFLSCRSLTSITIPNSVKTIGDRAFSGCSSLTSVTIPSSVTTIGNEVFYDCPNLTIYGIAGSYAQTYAQNNGIPFMVASALNGMILIPVERSQESISINAKGVGFANYQLVNIKNGVQTPLFNRTVRYGYAGYSQTYTATTNEGGYISFQTPTLTKDTNLTLQVASVSDSAAIPPAQSFSVKVTPLSFSQEWEGTLGAGAGASIGIGVGGKLGPASAEASIADIGAKGSAKPSMKLENSYENGKRSLTITNTLSREAAVDAKGGLFGKVNVGKSKVEITPVGVKGEAGFGDYNSIALKIDNYNPNSVEDLAKVGEYLIQSAVLVNGSNVVMQQILDYLSLNSYTQSSYGTKVKVGAGAKVGAIEFPINQSGGSTSVTLAGGNYNFVFGYGVTSYNNGKKALQTSLKSDGKVSFGEFGTLKTGGDFSFGLPTSAFAKNFLTRDTKLKTILSASGKPESFEIQGINENDAKEILWFQDSKNTYTTFRYSDAAIDRLAKQNDTLKNLLNGAKLLFSKEDLFKTVEGINNLNTDGTYTVSEKKEKGIDIEIPIGLKAIVGIDFTIYLSGIEGVEYDVESGMITGGRVLKQAEATGTESLVEGQRMSLGDMLSEPIQTLGDLVGALFTKTWDNISKGVESGAAAVKGFAEDTGNWIISIFTTNSPWSMQRSYLLMALPNTFSDDEEAYVATTVGDPYIIAVSDENGDEVSEFEPLSFSLSYSDEMLSIAGISPTSPLVDSLKIYYWDSDKKAYICQGGVLDKENKVVNLDITRGGQYILAIDNMAPDVNDFSVSDNTATPTIYATISDMSGLDISTFEFHLNDELLVSGDNFADYFNYETGRFTYPVSQPLSDGTYIASIFVSDSSGNALPQAIIYRFAVDTVPPEILYFIAPNEVSPEDELVIEAGVEGADRVFACISYANGDEWTEAEQLEMIMTEEGIWNITLADTLSVGKINVQIFAYDESGNTAQSDAENIITITDKGRLYALLEDSYEIIPCITEGEGFGFYLPGSKELIQNAITNAEAVLATPNVSQKSIEEATDYLSQTLVVVNTSAQGTIFMGTTKTEEDASALNINLSMFYTLEEQKNVQVVAGIYKDNKLYDVSYQSILLNEGINTTDWFKFEKENLPQGYTIKFMAFENLSNMEPLSRMYEPESL